MIFGDRLLFSTFIAMFLCVVELSIYIYIYVSYDMVLRAALFDGVWSVTFPKSDGKLREKKFEIVKRISPAHLTVSPDI